MCIVWCQHLHADMQGVYVSLKLRALAGSYSQTAGSQSEDTVGQITQPRWPSPRTHFLRTSVCLYVHARVSIKCYVNMTALQLFLLLLCNSSLLDEADDFKGSHTFPSKLSHPDQLRSSSLCLGFRKPQNINVCKFTCGTSSKSGQSGYKLIKTSGLWPASAWTQCISLLTADSLQYHKGSDSSPREESNK